MKNILFLLILILIISFFFQGKRGLWEPDEGRYAEVAREMIVTKDYLVPKLNLQPHLSKPPIVYWAIAISIKIFGKNEFAVRLPNSISFLFTVILIFLITKNLFNYEQAIFSAVIYSTSIFPFIGLNIVTTDTILTFFIWLYIFFYFINKYYLMSFALGLAFLSKGPPSLLPFLGILAFNIVYNRKLIDIKKILICFFIFFVTGIIWYILIILRNPSALDYFIHNELIGRLKGIHHRNSGAFDWLIYFPIIFFGLSPWVFFFYKKRKKIIFNDELRIFYFLIFIPLIVFCFAKSRLPLYVLPLMPAISIILSHYINIESNQIYKIAIITSFFLILLRIMAAYLPYSKNDKQIYENLKKYIKEKDYNLNFVTTKVWNGLNFYFNTIPEYLSLKKEKKLNKFSKKTVLDKIIEIQQTHTKNYFLISDKKKIVAFEKILSLYSKNLKIRKFRAKRFTIYLIE